MGSDIDIDSDHGWVTLTRHAPNSHVASLRIRVYSNSRRQGHGRALVRRAISAAQHHGIKRIEATPYVDNPESVSFFRSLPEFYPEGIRRRGGCRNGELIDTWLYAWVDC